MILKANAKATGLVEFVADHTKFRTVESLSSWMCPEGGKTLKKLLNCMHTHAHTYT